MRPFLCYVSANNFLNTSKTFLDCLANLLVVDFASDPFQRVGLFVLGLDCKLNFPERFWNKLLNLFSLVNTEAKGGSLTRSIRNCFIFSTATSDQRGKFLGLVTTEGHSKF